MAGEMLSQEEINALLGMHLQDETKAEEEAAAMDTAVDQGLTPVQVDALGEIGNISMGTAATTLFTLLNHKVLITTPKVEVLKLEEFKKLITEDMVSISVDYTEGLQGINLLILKETDVKVITDLMMGGTGAYADGPVTELHLSAIAEAMNQMIGSSSTSMSQMFNKKIVISPPQAIQMTNITGSIEEVFGLYEDVVKISFNMQIQDNIIDSVLMQIIPISFAKDLVYNLMGEDQEPTPAAPPVPMPEPSYIEKPVGAPEVPKANLAKPSYEMDFGQQMAMPTYGGGGHEEPRMVTNERMNHTPIKDVEVQRPEFPKFDVPQQVYPKENMDLLMDVSLEVSVELGRTQKKIKEILEFGPGSVIELDRLVGEPIDILVNGKFIAKGEVVVIDENFGVRITDIISPENRI